MTETKKPRTLVALKDELLEDFESYTNDDELKAEIQKTIKRTRLDKEIRSAILLLNGSGYTTLDSCAGHGNSRGYIVFLGILDRNQLKAELRKLGFTNYRTKHNELHDKTFVTFSPYHTII